MKKTIDIAQMMADMIDSARSRSEKETEKPSTTRVQETVDDAKPREDAKLHINYDGDSETVSADISGRNSDFVAMLAGIMERSEDLIPVFTKATLVALRNKFSDADDETSAKIDKLHKLFDRITD